LPTTWPGFGSFSCLARPDQHIFSSVPVTPAPAAVGNPRLWTKSPFVLWTSVGYPQAVHRQGEISFDQFPQPSLPYYGYGSTNSYQELGWLLKEKVESS
jgi:hypothetical protein